MCVGTLPRKKRVVHDYDLWRRNCLSYHSLDVWCRLLSSQRETNRINASKNICDVWRVRLGHHRDRFSAVPLIR
jgi:hypothetical protein